MIKKKKTAITYAFIDASNLFYGGEKSLGWKIDYEKLISYLKDKYIVSKVFYYAGIELGGFPYSILDNKPIDLDNLLAFYRKKNVEQRKAQRVKFYRKLQDFGYKLRLKPVKIFKDEKGRISKKANCDVDLTFDMMRLKDEYTNAVLISGDGDFAILAKYIISIGKKIHFLARGERTAREIRQLAGKNFQDFHYLREILRFKE
ncbi:MAG: NYN domain-containing protein [Candidatus Levybacteria bacterium]|nr:NYN domain-containing protein [Candidatus Levybacteria bacterium]